jgi:hypothetical protein
MNITIIGGGAGGCGTALELAAQGHKITIIEKRKELLQGTSDRTPCRLGLGFHYIDPDTAKKYLRATIAVVKKYPGFSVAADKDESHPHRRGRYFIVQDSQFSVPQILAVYQQLREEYARLIQEDESNKVFGDPENFFKILSINEYQNDVNCEKVVLGIETSEQILNWPLFREALIIQLRSNPNITILTDTTFIDVTHHPDDYGYELAIDQSNTPLRISADCIINAAWENVEPINHRAGFFMQPHSRTNRLKVIVEIKLSENIERNKPLNSMFFCFGAHCSLNNIGNGRAFLSYEPKTNIESSDSLELPLLSQRLLAGIATREEIDAFGKAILMGAIDYIPLLQGAEIIGAKFGIVKTKGTVDIYSPNSEFHKRDYSGVDTQQLYWIDNSCMKLMYFLENAKEVSDVLHLHAQISEGINTILTNVISTESETDLKLLKQAIRKNLQRTFTLKDFTDLKPIMNTITNKKLLCNEIKSAKSSHALGGKETILPISSPFLDKHRSLLLDAPQDINPHDPAGSHHKSAP